MLIRKPSDSLPSLSKGRGGKEVSCQRVFEEEKPERWTELCDRNLTLKLLPEFKGVVAHSASQIGGIWFAWINRSGSQPPDRSMVPLGIWRKLWFFLFPPLYHEAIMLFYCQRGSLTYKSQACNLNSPKLGHHGALSDVSLNTAREWFSTAS